MTYLCLVENFFVDAPSGAPRVAWDVARAMARAGHEAVYLCFAQGQAEVTEERIEGVRVVRCAPPRRTMLSYRLGENVQCAVLAAATRLRLGSKFWDVVHVHSPLMAAPASRVFACARRRIYTMHSPTVPELQLKWRQQGMAGKLKSWLGTKKALGWERFGIVAADSVHCLSKFTLAELERWHGKELVRKAAVVPHWISSEWSPSVAKCDARRKLGWPEEAMIAFTVRGHKPRTGIGVAIEALAPLVEMGRCLFYIGGDGPLRGQYESQARNLGCHEPGMVFTGRLSQEALMLAYQAADVFLLPTVDLECFGLILLEATGLGCPVIATDAGAIAEVAAPLNGISVVEAGNAIALRQKVSQWLSGELVFPPAQEIVTQAQAAYGQERVWPRYLELLVGGHGLEPWTFGV